MSSTRAGGAGNPNLRHKEVKPTTTFIEMSSILPPLTGDEAPSSTSANPLPPSHQPLSSAQLDRHNKYAAAVAAASGSVSPPAVAPTTTTATTSNSNSLTTPIPLINTNNSMFLGNSIVSATTVSPTGTTLGGGMGDDAILRAAARSIRPTQSQPPINVPGGGIDNNNNNVRNGPSAMGVSGRGGSTATIVIRNGLGGSSPLASPLGSPSAGGGAATTIAKRTAPARDPLDPAVGGGRGRATRRLSPNNSPLYHQRRTSPTSNSPRPEKTEEERQKEKEAKRQERLEAERKRRLLARTGVGEIGSRITQMLYTGYLQDQLTIRGAPSKVSKELASLEDAARYKSWLRGMLSLLSVLSFITSMVDIQFETKKPNHIINMFLCLAGMVCVVLVYKIKARQAGIENPLYGSEATLLHSPYLGQMCVEFALWVFTPPYFVSVLHIWWLSSLDFVSFFRLYNIALWLNNRTYVNRTFCRAMSAFSGIRLTTGYYMRTSMVYRKMETSVITVVIAWIAVALAFSKSEGRSYWDSLYFMFVTAATIGYGDIAPVTVVGRISAFVAWVFGLLILGWCVSIFQMYLNLSDPERNLYILFRTNELTDLIRNDSARLIQMTFRIYIRNKITKKHTILTDLALWRLSRLTAKLKKMRREFRSHVTAYSQVIASGGGGAGGGGEASSSCYDDAESSYLYGHSPSAAAAAAASRAMSFASTSAAHLLLTNNGSMAGANPSLYSPSGAMGGGLRSTKSDKISSPKNSAGNGPSGTSFALPSLTEQLRNADRLAKSAKAAAATSVDENPLSRNFSFGGGPRAAVAATPLPFMLTPTGNPLALGAGNYAFPAAAIPPPLLGGSLFLTPQMMQLTNLQQQQQGQQGRQQQQQDKEGGTPTTEGGEASNRGEASGQNTTANANEQGGGVAYGGAVDSSAGDASGPPTNAHPSFADPNANNNINSNVQLHTTQFQQQTNTSVPPGTTLEFLLASMQQQYYEERVWQHQRFQHLTALLQQQSTAIQHLTAVVLHQHQQQPYTPPQGLTAMDRLASAAATTAVVRTLSAFAETAGVANAGAIENSTTIPSNAQSASAAPSSSGTVNTNAVSQLAVPSSVGQNTQQQQPQQAAVITTSTPPALAAISSSSNGVGVRGALLSLPASINGPAAVAAVGTTNPTNSTDLLLILANPNNPTTAVASTNSQARATAAADEGSIEDDMLSPSPSSPSSPAAAGLGAAVPPSPKQGEYPTAATLKRDEKDTNEQQHINKARQNTSATASSAGAVNGQASTNAASPSSGAVMSAGSSSPESDAKNNNAETDASGGGTIKSAET